MKNIVSNASRALNAILFIILFSPNISYSKNCNFLDKSLYLEQNLDRLETCLYDQTLTAQDLIGISLNGDAWTLDDAIVNVPMNQLVKLFENDLTGNPLSHKAVINEFSETLITLAWYDFDLGALSNPEEGGWFKSDSGTSSLHLAYQQNKLDHASFILSLVGSNSTKDLSGRVAGDYATGLGKELQSIAEGNFADDVYDTPRKYGIFGTEKDVTGSCDEFLTEQFFSINDAKGVYQCLREGAQIHGANSDMDTALHIAARNTEDPDVILALLSSLDDFEQVAEALGKKNLKGNTPLHEASAITSYPDVITRLLFWGSKVDATNHKGQTSVHLAAKRQDESAEYVMARLLVSPDINGLFGVKKVVDYDGNSPLHFAARFDAYGILRRLLLLKGFDPDQRNNRGVTPLMVSAEDKINSSASRDNSSTEEFSDFDQIVSFLDFLEFSEKPCEPVPDKYPELAGVTVPIIAAKNPSLLLSNTSGKDVPALSILHERCNP